MKFILSIVLTLLLLLPATSQAARLFTCGFEENALATTMWTTAGSNATIVTTTPHSGTNSLQLASTTNKTITRNLAAAVTAPNTVFFARFYWQTSSAGQADSRIFSNNSSVSTYGVSVTKLTSGKMRLRNNPTAETVDSTMTITANTLYRLEVRHKISDTAGEEELRIYLGDATTPLETVTMTFAGTADTLPTDILVFTLEDSALNNNLTYLYDDIAINDDSGSFQTSWPGPGKIALVKPASDTTVTWTKGGSGPSGTNFGGISEVPGTPDDAVTLNCDSAACVAALDTNEDKLGLSTITAEVPSNAVMALIDVYGRVNVATAVSGTMALVTWDDGATRTQGPTMTVSSTTWRNTTTAEHQVSNLSAKTKATTQNYSIGYKSLTGTVAKQVTALWANVEWIEAPVTSVPQSGNGFLPVVIR